jgi:hypothetical protein
MGSLRKRWTLILWKERCLVAAIVTTDTPPAADTNILLQSIKHDLSYVSKPRAPQSSVATCIHSNWSSLCCTGVLHKKLHQRLAPSELDLAVEVDKGTVNLV